VLYDFQEVVSATEMDAVLVEHVESEYKLYDRLEPEQLPVW